MIPGFLYRKVSVAMISRAGMGTLPARRLPINFQVALLVLLMTGFVQTNAVGQVHSSGFAATPTSGIVATPASGLVSTPVPGIASTPGPGIVVTPASGIAGYEHVSSDSPSYEPGLSIDFPSGEIRKTGWSDMMPKTMQGNYYNEFWTYHFYLENDLHVHITFSLANFGTFKSAVSGGKLFVSNFKGGNYHVFREFRQELFMVDDSLQKMRLHPGRDIFFSGALPDSHRVRFATSKGGVDYLVDLSFSDIEEGMTWGDGVFRVRGDEMGLFIHIPKARVTGVVAINGDTLRVSGTAYMDHTYQTDLSSKVIDKGFRYVSHHDDGYRIGFFLLPSKRRGEEVVGWSLIQENGKQNMRKPVRINVRGSKPVDDRPVPLGIEIIYEDDEREILVRQELYQHVSFLHEVTGIRRRLARNFLGGEVIEYVGTGTLDNRLPVHYHYFIVH